VSPLYREHRPIDIGIRDHLVYALPIQFLAREEGFGQSFHGRPNGSQRLQSDLLEAIDFEPDLVIGARDVQLHHVLDGPKAIAILEVRENRSQRRIKAGNDRKTYLLPELLSASPG